MKYKKIGKAIGDLIEAYEAAIHDSGVHKPISFALYNTWKKWDGKENSRNPEHEEVHIRGANE